LREVAVASGQDGAVDTNASRRRGPQPRRRGPQPRHTRQEVVRAAIAIADADGLDAVTIRAVAGRLEAGVMSLYSYVPDKQTLVYDMVEEVSGELALPEPSGDWRADMHLLARLQRAALHRHPWMIEATSHLQPLGPAIVATLEFALGALEPTGLTAGARLETFALVNGFVTGLVRAELASQAAAVPDPTRSAVPGPARAADQAARAAVPDPARAADQAARAADQAARLGELLATGRYPRFAAAVAQGGPPAAELGAQFERLLDRILDGLVSGAGP
jgi:AcrR family transcriptional regulator